jgi:UDP-N-acetylglucosamine 2-epimerase (non-hydrolysing)
VLAGTVKLVGTDHRRIIDEARMLLDNPAAYNAMARVHNPYGDGQASSRIAELIRSFLTRET